MDDSALFDTNEPGDEEEGTFRRVIRSTLQYFPSVATMAIAVVKSHDPHPLPAATHRRRGSPPAGGWAGSTGPICSLCPLQK